MDKQTLKCNFMENVPNKNINDFEVLNIKIKTSASLTKSEININKLFEQNYDFLISKAMALYEGAMPDEVNDNTKFSSSQSKDNVEILDFPRSPVITYKDNYFVGSNLSLR